MINSISSAGLEGIRKGTERIDHAASKIAGLDRSNDFMGDVTSSAIELQQGKMQVQVSSKVLAAEGDMLGSLLDIKA